MATVTALAKKDDSADPRVALKSALAASAIARREMSAIEDAISRAERLVWAGRAKLEAVRKSITAAKREDAAALAESLLSGGSVPPRAVQSAREEEVAAGDALEAARSAVVTLETDLKDAEREVERANKTINVAIAAVLKPTAQQMIEEGKRFRAGFLQRQFALDALCTSLDGFERLRSDIRDDEYRALRATICQPWLDVITALQRDADAPLPEMK